MTRATSPDGGAATQTGRRARSLYASAPTGDRLHVALRWRSAPFPTVERAVPRSGRVLEVGCGHGLLAAYLALRAPLRQVTGVDIDAAKIALARAAASRLDPGEAELSFGVVEPDGVAPGPWDAVVIADVLYLLPRPQRLELVDRCAEELAPDGRLVIKETDVEPRWKAELTRVQELVATRVLGITEGATVDFDPPSVLAGHLAAVGFEVEGCRIDRGALHPHHLLVARRT